MAKRYTTLLICLIFCFLAFPGLVHATGDPEPKKVVQPRMLTKADSIAIALGHCNPETLPVVDCSTGTITLTAVIVWTFSGLIEPVVATWNTGDVSHKITVVPPGFWDWDASGTTCEPSHWNTDYDQPGSFFDGPLELTATPAICVGETAIIDLINPTGYDFQTYNWTPTGGGSAPPLEVSTPGNYTLTLTDQLGCPFMEQINIPASPPVLPVITGPQAVCPYGDTAFIQVPMNFSHYEWSTGDTLNPSMIFEPGLYSVTVTNQYGCTGEKEIVIPSGEVVAVNVSANMDSICPGQSSILIADFGYQHYEWSNGDLGVTNIVTDPGIYEVTVTNIYGCTGTGSTTVSPLPTPTIEITTTPFCPGDVSTLTVTGGTFQEYLWSNSDTINPITVSTSGTYSVTVSGSSICATSTSISVVQNPAPTSLIAPPAQLICTSPTTMLDASASSNGPEYTYLWTTSDGNIVSGQGTLTPEVDSAGNYTLLVTNTATGCTSSATVVVSSDMQAPPAPTGNPATLTCVTTDLDIGPIPPPGDTTLMPSWFASGGGNILMGQDSWNPNIDAPGLYTLVVTNPANGCTSTGTVQIDQDINDPSAIIAPPNQITCTTNTVSLDGSASSNGAGFTYLWTTSNGTITGNTNTAISEAGSIGVYDLLVTNTTNGCTASASITVTADANIPDVSALMPAPLTCVVPSVTIDASQSSSGPDFTYTWTGPVPGSIISGQGTLQPTVNAAGTYTLQLVNTLNSCSATLSVVVPEDITPPLANAGTDSTLNCITPSMVLDGTASSSGPNFIYQWSTVNGNIVSGTNGLTPTIDTAGIYVLQVTNQTNGCTATSSVQVLNDVNAPMALIAQPATLTCVTLQTLVDAQASSQGPTYTYSWSGPGIISGQGSTQISVDQPGTYTLDIVNTANGCTDTETVIVPQDIVPPAALAGNDVLINCFTPTGDIGDLGNPPAPDFTLAWSTTDGTFTSPTDGPTATISSAGTYTLVVTNNINGCTSTDDVLVTADFAVPAADAGPTEELTCIMPNTVLQGTASTGAGFVYLWTTADGHIVSGENTLNPLIDQEGLYSLLVTNSQNGCTNTADVTITISADVPISVIAPPALLTCSITSIPLNGAGSTAGPTIVYSWTASNGGNITGSNNSLSTTIDAPGTYTLNVFDSSNSCSSSKTIIVNEDLEPPVVLASPDNTLTCTILNLPIGATIQSSSSQNLVYTWSTPTGTIDSGGNTPNPTVSSTGIYTVVVTDNFNGCTGTDEVEIFEDVAAPLVNIALPETLNCVLEQTQIDALSSSAGAEFTYQWTSPDGNIVSGDNTLTPTVDAPGTYNLVITNNDNGCTETGVSIVAEDIAPPTALAGNSVGLDCDTQTNSLDGTGSSQGVEFTYMWTTSNGQILSGFNSLTPEVGDPGTYILTVNNTQNGCSSTSSVVVTEDLTTPAFSIATPDLLTCVTTVAQLAATGQGFGTSPTYTWTTGNGNITAGGSTLNATADAPGTYTLTIVNTQTGCTDVEQIIVDENVTPPPISALPVLPLTCTVFERILQANTSAQATLQWSTLDGHIASGANSANPVVDEPGLYTVTATLPLNGCTNTTDVTLLQEMNIPTGLDYSLDPPLCNGILGTVTVEQIVGGIGPFEYSIDGGSTFFPASQINNLTPGDYDLVIRDANGCEVEEHIPVPPPPTPGVTLPPSFSIQIGENQELLADIPPGFPLNLIEQVIWDPMDNLTFDGNTILDLLNPVAMPFVTTEYQVTILTAEGCKATARTLIKVDREIDIYAPNIIWPEDPDGTNNSFTIFTREGSVNQIEQLQIFDRWGSLVFENKNFLPDDPSIGWTGENRGLPVNPGVFVWWAKVELIDGRTVLLKGDVTVMR